MLQEFTSEIKQMVRDMMDDVHTTIPAKVVSYNARTGEATVQPSNPNYPPIANVPVMMPNAGMSAGISCPVEAGNECMLMFSEQSLDSFRNQADGATPARFGLQNAVAIGGLSAKPSPAAVKASLENAVIITSKGDIALDAEANISLKSKADSIYIDSLKENISMKAAVRIKSEASVEIVMEAGTSITITSGSELSIISPTINIIGDIEVTGSLKVNGIDLPCGVCG